MRNVKFFVFDICVHPASGSANAFYWKDMPATASILKTQTVAIDADCIGERWETADQATLARLIAIMAMGQASYAGHILETLDPRRTRDQYGATPSRSQNQTDRGRAREDTEGRLSALAEGWVDFRSHFVARCTAGLSGGVAQDTPCECHIARTRRIDDRAQGRQERNFTNNHF